MTAKTLILGFDGGDGDFIDAMIGDGELPNFARIRAVSSVQPVDNDPGQGNVQFWKCAAIGEGPDHHGHYFYLQFDPRTYDIRLDHEIGLPDVTPFWVRLDREGYRIAVADWYEMPVTPLKNGTIIHRWLPHESLTSAVFAPESLRQETAKYVPFNPIAESFASRPRETPEALLDFFKRVLGRIEGKARFFADQIKREDWDLYIACFSDAHSIGHYYFHLQDENHWRYDPAAAALIKEPLQQCYRALDDAVGIILDAAGDDANVFLFAGPGMEPFTSANTALDEMARRMDLGYSAAQAAPLSSAETAKKAYRSFLPEELRRRVAPFARAVRHWFVDNEYKRRRFFALPHGDGAGAIRINKKGRERYGVVAPGAEYDALVDEIRESLASFRDAADGRPIVKRVISIAHEYNGPYRDMLPDIFVEWDREGRHGGFENIVSDKFGEIAVPPSTRSGDHHERGYLWSPAKLNLSTAPARPKDVAAIIIDAVRRYPEQRAGIDTHRVGENVAR